MVYRRFLLCSLLSTALGFLALSAAINFPAPPAKQVTATAWQPPLWSADSVVTWDYPIVCCRSPRSTTAVNEWGRVSNSSLSGTAGTDLVLIQPNGTETVLVAGGADALADPCVSFDGSTVYFTRLYAAPKQIAQSANGPPTNGSDIFSVNVQTGAVTQLTNGGYQPNQAADDSRAGAYRVWNAQPCVVPDPLIPGRNRIVFVSNRNGYRPPRFTTGEVVCTQLFVMDDDGSNVEKFGFLNVASAISPVVLRNGTVAFSSLEHQNLRSDHLWSLWGIDPDGTSWYPLFFDADIDTEPGNAYHFAGQLGDGRIVMEEYYLSSPFGTLFVWPEPGAAPVFNGANVSNLPNIAPSTPPWNDYITPKAFEPVGVQGAVPWSNDFDGGAYSSAPGTQGAPLIGKVTHPSGAPHNDLLAAWTPGNAQAQTDIQTQICVIPGGNATTAPNGMRLLWQNPSYNYFFPKAIVPYQTIYNMAAPQTVPVLANDGAINPNLPSGTPFGLIGTSSMYKRESFPFGKVGADPSQPVTATWNGKVNPTDITSLWRGVPPSFGSSKLGAKNWYYQGAETSLYTNDDIAAVRLLAMEVLPNPLNPGATGTFAANFVNSANERLRILGEFPVRKFASGAQTTDPDGNPDTSWMAKIPADTPFTFQMLDNNGMVLTMAQTWHQVRPGEMRVNCGGCHAHSQIPTNFANTTAGQPGFAPWDVSTGQTPLLTSRANDTSGQQWDANSTVGLKYVSGLKNVEFYRDILPVLTRSCVPCHNGTANLLPGNVRFDDSALAAGFQFNGVVNKSVPRNYALFANNVNGTYGGYPILGHANSPIDPIGGSRYAFPMKARASLLIWKIFGARLDGRQNADIPTESTPGDPTTLPLFNGKPIAVNQYQYCDIDFDGNQCPPPGATVNGVAVPPLSDDEKRDFARWIDLGMPIDTTYNPSTGQATATGGWMQDDTPPTLTLYYPTRGANASLATIAFGVADAYSGVDPKGFSVKADFTVDGNAPGTELSGAFVADCGKTGCYAYTLQTPLASLAAGTLTIKVADLAGNRTVLARRFSVGANPPPPAKLSAKRGTAARGMLIVPKVAAAPTSGTSERRRALANLQAAILDSRRSLERLQLQLNRLQGIEGPAPGTVNPPPFRGIKSGKRTLPKSQPKLQATKRGK